CFRAVARRWSGRVTREYLLIEGGVPISSGLTLDVPPPTISKLIDASIDVIARIELEFGGLWICFERTGGGGPQLFRQSFFDQVRIELRGPSALEMSEIQQLIRELDTCLKVGTAFTTEDLRLVSEALGSARISAQRTV
ncbi:MAG TPA: hypothetical protein VFS47_10285, partial [Steroidobacteraceae bacterium]|nr:hypothetical protein [Steroidobacteraceae bacterium]